MSADFFHDWIRRAFQNQNLALSWYDFQLSKKYFSIVSPIATSSALTRKLSILVPYPYLMTSVCCFDSLMFLFSPQDKSGLFKYSLKRKNSFKKYQDSFTISHENIEQLHKSMNLLKICIMQFLSDYNNTALFLIKSSQVDRILSLEYLNSHLEMQFRM